MEPMQANLNLEGVAPVLHPTIKTLYSLSKLDSNANFSWNEAQQALLCVPNACWFRSRTLEGIKENLIDIVKGFSNALKELYASFIPNKLMFIKATLINFEEQVHQAKKVIIDGQKGLKESTYQPLIDECIEDILANVKSAQKALANIKRPHSAPPSQIPLNLELKALICENNSKRFDNIDQAFLLAQALNEGEQKEKALQGLVWLIMRQLTGENLEDNYPKAREIISFIKDQALKRRTKEDFEACVQRVKDSVSQLSLPLSSEVDNYALDPASSDLSFMPLTLEKSIVESMRYTVQNISQSMVFSLGKACNVIPRLISNYRLDCRINDIEKIREVLASVNGERIDTTSELLVKNFQMSVSDKSQSYGADEKIDIDIEVPKPFYIDLLRQSNMILNGENLGGEIVDIAIKLYEIFGKEGAKRLMLICNQSLAVPMVEAISFKEGYLRKVFGIDPKEFIVPDNVNNYHYSINVKENAVHIEAKILMEIKYPLLNDYDPQHFVAKTAVVFPLELFTKQDLKPLRSANILIDYFKALKSAIREQALHRFLPDIDFPQEGLNPIKNLILRKIECVKDSAVLDFSTVQHELEDPFFKRFVDQLEYIRGFENEIKKIDVKGILKQLNLPSLLVEEVTKYFNTAESFLPLESFIQFIKDVVKDKDLSAQLKSSVAHFLNKEEFEFTQALEFFDCKDLQVSDEVSYLFVNNLKEAEELFEKF